MKLRKDYLTHTVGGEQVIVPVGEASKRFHGIVRSNKTAAYLVDLLKEDTTPEALVEAMEAKYDAPRAQIETDVLALLDQLRDIGALDE